MEAELRFEKESKRGIAVVGSYLIDAAGRLGVTLEAECERAGQCDSCAVKILKGGDCLSALTANEKEQLSNQRRKDGERLTCQAKITKAGEISIMTHEKKTEEKPPHEQQAEDYKKAFAKLPLEQKIAQLVDLEAITLSDTISYVLSSPQTIGGKIVDILAQFGFKIEDEAKKAKQPAEHRNEASAEPASDTEEDKATETTADKTPPKRPRRKAAPKKKVDKDPS